MFKLWKLVLTYYLIIVIHKFELRNKMREKNFILVKSAITSLSAFIFLFLSLFCFGATIRVPQDYASIQAAINAAVTSDEIIVTTGTYCENIEFKGKNIILRSTDPENPSIVGNTVINGQNLEWESVVTFAGSESTSCVLSGFTITLGESYHGEGILGNGTLAKIQYNTITGNRADWGGGLSGCHGTIQYNTITGNTAQEGGGLYGCSGTIQYNTITGNTACYGGGLYGCSGTIQNNTITGNTAEPSGGGFSDCDGIIQNNTITGNTAWRGGGLYNCNGMIQNNTISGNINYGNGGGLAGCGSAIKNCIIWGNSAPGGGAQLDDSSTPTYSCIQDWTLGGMGNISFDPKLLLPELGEFHLKADSPCIDSGCLISDLTMDIEGDTRGYDGTSEPRGDGSDYDIGSDEYIGTFPVFKVELIYYFLGRLAGIDRDFNGDSIIDVADLIWLIKNGK